MLLAYTRPGAKVGNNLFSIDANQGNVGVT
jgi:hypothetical protein